MIDQAARLRAILHGQTVDRPPLWDPWFAMGRFLRDHYQGDYLSMAEDLGHAAVPVGIIRTAVDFFDHHRFQAACTRPGGLMRHSSQKVDDADPYWDEQLRGARQGTQVVHEVGRLTWITFKWCFDAISGAMGLTDLALACYDQPGSVAEAMDWVERRNRAAIRHIVPESNVDFVLFEGNCAYQAGPMIEPSMLRQFCFEPTRRTLDLLRNMGVPFAFHTEGLLAPVMPMLIELGFACVHGCDPQANDLGALVEQWGDRIALAGNMDVAMLATATPEQVTAATRRMLDLGSARGRFIASPNTAIQDDVPAENYIAMCRAVDAWAAG